MFLGIELGGTKIIMATGTAPDDLSPMARIETRDPETTARDMIETGRRLIAQCGGVEGIGVASFGPIGLKAGSETYGQILRTAKAGWSYFPVLDRLADGFPEVPLTLDTDVNAAALAERTWGGAKGLETFAYVTVGTGIGVGLYCEGRLVHGLLHPEAGHIHIPHDRQKDPFPGVCPLHGDCLEGLASGPSVAARLGRAGETVADDDAVWELIGGYLGVFYSTLAMTVSPERILVGGGVGLKPRVLAVSRDAMFSALNGYIEPLAQRATIDSYIAPAQLGDRAGILGAIALARNGVSRPIQAFA